MKHQEITEELRLKSYQLYKLNRDIRNLTDEIVEMQSKIDTVYDYITINIVNSQKGEIT